MSPVAPRHLAAPLLGVLLLTGGRHAGEAELVVRNDSFSTLAIAIVAEGRGEAVIGQAPPEFTNTLYFPVGADAVEVRFRALLRGSGEVVHESRPVRVRQGARLRWSLPDNVMEALGGDRTAATATATAVPAR
jgi:hypothetical protein